MKHNVTQRPSCQWPRHPSRSSRASYSERPFDLGEAFWYDTDHTK